MVAPVTLRQKKVITYKGDVFVYVLVFFNSFIKKKKKNFGGGVFYVIIVQLVI